MSNETNEDFGPEIRQWLSDQGSNEDRADFLPDFLVWQGSAVIVELNDDLLPLKTDGKWVILMWPTEEEARNSLDGSPLVELGPDDTLSFKTLTLDHIEAKTIPYLVENGELLGAFPCKDMTCNYYEATEFKKRIASCKRIKHLLDGHDAGKLTPAEQREFDNMFQLRLKADIDLRDRVREKLKAQRAVKSL